MIDAPRWMVDLGHELATDLGNEIRPVVAFAPGRVNLIGEHTDYNDGWVLPMAIKRYAAVAAAPRGDGVLRARSVVFQETAEIRLDKLTAPGDSDWFDYVAGTAWALSSSGYEVNGADLVVNGDVPLGSGLSSSAALEMAVARALCAVWEVPWRPLEMARVGQKTEREFIGVSGGLMDQFTAVMGEVDRALLLDCRTMTFRSVAMPAEAIVVVMDTGAPRTLSGSAYNQRSAACRKAVAMLQRNRPTVAALRDVDLEMLESEQSELGEQVTRWCRHVVEEIERPEAMARALESGNLGRAGDLMNASHISLRNLYEVSSPELDLVTDLARQHPACFGARLTGAGFGGCAIALVRRDGVDAFMDEVHRSYRAQVNLPSAVFPVRPGGGAGLIDASCSR